MEEQEVVAESAKKKENKLVSGGKKLGKKVSNFFADFKKFISRGNIVDMAVGVIIGAAFSSIVKALTDKIIMPLINLLLSIGNSDGKSGLEKAYTFLKVAYDAEGKIDLSKSIYIDWGAFITAVIEFLIIAFVLFVILRTMMQAKLMAQTIEKQNSKARREEKKAIKALAKKEGISYSEAVEKFNAEKKAKEEAEAQKAEEVKSSEEPSKPAFESQEDILKDIRTLLQMNAGATQNISIKSDSNN